MTSDHWRQTRLTLSVAFGGFTVFALLYAPQSVLPVLARGFSLTEAQASLSVTVATAALAVGVLPIAMLSEAVGRRPVMLGALIGAVVLALLCPYTQTFEALLVMRALQGLAVAGLPAVAMAYLAEEIEPGRVGTAMGRYVAANSLGGLSGRLVSGLGTAWGTWHAGLFAVALLSTVTGVLAIVLLPRSTAPRKGLKLPKVLGGVRTALRDPVLYGPYVVALLLMGVFVAVHNVVTFRLTSAPFHLSPAVVSLVFLCYAVGGVASALAGRAADRHGRLPALLVAIGLVVLGLMLTLPDDVTTIVVGLCVLTGGFFAAHSVASGWVGARAPASARGQASAIYLLAYYLGSSVGGTLGGLVFAPWGWLGVVAMSCCWLVAAAAVALGAGLAWRDEVSDALAQKSRDRAIAALVEEKLNEPRLGRDTEPEPSDTVTDRTSSGTSTTRAVGKTSPP
ncbi:YNFM family putative membrane transporter [Crossiella equi]|uniref:YNFM family putative membrane transporter n=1 Tax=Crossiella equi TaxID=130796 RepID=A0ABS5AIR0_9PSEU|nr:MFS transporter [Crossiella equi]MBP2476467.1 YNFM family putative membrane transporter [Crossiella equi]